MPLAHGLSHPLNRAGALWVESEPQNNDRASILKGPSFNSCSCWVALGKAPSLCGLQVLIVMRKLLWKLKDPFSLKFLRESNIAKKVKMLGFELCFGHIITSK